MNNIISHPRFNRVTTMNNLRKDIFLIELRLMEIRNKAEGKVLEEDKPEYFKLSEELENLKSKLTFMKKDNTPRIIVNKRL